MPAQAQSVTTSHIPAADLLPDLCQVRAVLWLILFSEALVLVLILLSSGAMAFSLESFALLSVYVQWVVLVSAACLCRIRLHAGNMTLNQLMLLSFVIIMVVNLIISVCTMWGLNALLLEQQGLDWLLRNQLTSAILAVLLLHYFYVQLQNRLQARSELQARIQALQSRIRPHFLFNSMNIIASLIHEDPDKAEMAVEDLSELFRASLKEAGVEVSLKQELALCEKYINIETLRLGERLTVNWQVEHAERITIPLLTLQPLIENAIYHGIQPSANGGVVDIRIQLKNNWVNILVSNPVVTQHHARKDHGNQMALSNIEHRLHALYGEQAQMKYREEQQTFMIELHYPLRDVKS